MSTYDLRDLHVDSIDVLAVGSFGALSADTV